MADTWINGIPFIMVVKRFTLVHKEYPMRILQNRLYHSDGVGMLRDAIGVWTMRRVVLRIHFLPKYPPLKGTAGLSLLLRGQAWWQACVRQERCLGVTFIIFMNKVLRDVLPIQKDADMKPCLCMYWRAEQILFYNLVFSRC